MEQNKHLKKVFTGKTKFVLDHSSPEALQASKQDRHFWQRMLRAFNAGKETFYFGQELNSITGKYQPVEYVVQFKYEDRE
jgi:hypothetical protein